MRRPKTNTISVRMPTDEKGMVGRKCPHQDCEHYFKVKPGTGLAGDVPCHCPYCGHVGGSDDFWTPEQKKYLEAVAKNYASEQIHRMLKTMEFETKPQGQLGLSTSMKVTGGPHRFRYSYREKELETEVVCDRCRLVYAVYGAFAWCPDCASRNSLTILNKNLELAEKLLGLARTQENDLAEHLIGDALENVVSAFDGFGREVCRVAAPKATAPADAEDVRFQNLSGARNRVQKLFGIDLMAAVSADNWEFAGRCFQKRHLLAHKMGVVDLAYIGATNDPTAVVGRKSQIRAEEVKRLVDVVRQLGGQLASQLLLPSQISSNVQ